jgi:hypothetical protein
MSTKPTSSASPQQFWFRCCIGTTANHQRIYGLRCMLIIVINSECAMSFVTVMSTMYRFCISTNVIIVVLVVALW